MCVENLDDVLLPCERLRRGAIGARGFLLRERRCGNRDESSRQHGNDFAHCPPLLVGAGTAPYLRRFQRTMALPPEAPAAFIVVNSSPLTLILRIWSCAA